MMMTESKLVSVHNTRDVLYAEVIAAALEGEGIRCLVDNEHQAGLTGVLEVHVLVAAEHAEQARKFIEEHEANRQTSGDDEAE
jgi:hypothetical protein